MMTITWDGPAEPGQYITRDANILIFRKLENVLPDVAWKHLITPGPGAHVMNGHRVTFILGEGSGDTSRNLDSGSRASQEADDLQSRYDRYQPLNIIILFQMC